MFFHPSTEAPSAQLTATPILYMYARAYEIEVPSPVEWSSVQSTQDEALYQEGHGKFFGER